MLWGQWGLFSSAAGGPSLPGLPQLCLKLMQASPCVLGTRVPGPISTSVALTEACTGTIALLVVRTLFLVGSVLCVFSFWCQLR